MKNSVHALMSHLETTGALCYEHGDSASDRHTRKQLEVEVQADPDFEILTNTAYQLIARKRKSC